MGESTAIAWTDHTFNPWWGCARVSPGCQHCYAEAFDKRVGGDHWGVTAERRFFGDKHWYQPARWNAQAEAEGRPHLVFCSSMADVFEDRRELAEHRERLFRIIDSTPALIWQLLTKRPENVRGMVPYSWIESIDITEMQDRDRRFVGPSWPSNVWIGTTVEDQQRADERIPHLLDIPAPVRFLSCEPLLGPLRLDPWFWLNGASTAGPWRDARGRRRLTDGAGRRLASGPGGQMFSSVRSSDIGWVIVGGESGPGHRPLNLDHARRLVIECEAAGVPVFFKQVGGRTPTSGGDEIDGRVIKQFPAAARRSEPMR